MQRIKIKKLKKYASEMSFFLLEGNWFTHIPWYSKLVRDEDEEEEWSLAIKKPAKKSKARMVAYPLATHPGISGGAVVVDDIVIGNQIIRM